MDAGSSGAKWLVGALIAFLAAGGGIVALLNYIHPSPPSSGSSPPADSRPTTDGGATAKVTPTPRVCTIEGGVYNDDINPAQPIANVRINYIPHQENGATYLTTTGPSGQFKGDCAHISSKQFPLTLELSSPHWQGVTSKTPEQVEENGKDNINIYVSLKEINNGIIRSQINRIRIVSRSSVIR
jgi:hypothetical protein